MQNTEIELGRRFFQTRKLNLFADALRRSGNPHWEKLKQFSFSSLPVRNQVMLSPATRRGETHFCHFYPHSHSFCHYPKLMSIGEAWKVD